MNSLKQRLNFYKLALSNYDNTDRHHDGLCIVMGNIVFGEDANDIRGYYDAPWDCYYELQQYFPELPDLPEGFYNESVKKSNEIRVKNLLLAIEKCEQKLKQYDKS